MRRKILILFCFSLTLLIKIKGQKNPLQISGTVPVHDSLYMKSTEVTIKEWIEFIVNNNFEKTLFPVRSGLSENAVLIFDQLNNDGGKNYFQFIKQSVNTYNYTKVITVKPDKDLKRILKTDTTGFSLDIPITGITFEQAIAFCTWKEGVINERKTIKVKLSIPSIEIYKSVIPDKDSLNLKKCPLFNWAFCNCATVLRKDKSKNFQGKFLLRADSYWPSLQGLYNLQGNAAEMTATKGIAMGGSFRHFARESYRDKIQEYNKPEDWLGFRYMVTLK